MRRLIPLLLFCLAAGVRLLVQQLSGYAVDDAFISFRYAENIAAGNGFVYNLGERVLGTTTPLFTLIIAGCNHLGLGSLKSALTISIASASLTAVILYRWGGRIGLKKLAYLPALLYILFPRSVTADISGMETALFTFLLLLSFYLLAQKKLLLAVTTASLAAITRPEGVIALLAVVGVSLFLDRRQLIVRAIPVLLVLGNWLTFSYVYFGVLAPNSIAAKSALYHSHWNLGLGKSLQFVFGLSSPIGWILLLFFLMGMFFRLREKHLLSLIGLFVVGYLVTLAAAQTHIFFWYPAPVYPLMFLIATVGIKDIWQRIPVLRSFRQDLIIVSLTALIAGAAFIGLNRRVDSLRWEMDCYERIHQQAGRYLVLHAKPEDKVIAEDIGHLGYIYRGTIIDRDGLITPEAIPFNRSGNYKEFIDSVAADWLFIATDLPTSRVILEADDFEERYQVALTLTAPGANQYLLCRK
ncbi:MAG: hypothetical protein KAT58_01110 [candidate division Zixibacteria bacterium]|nr:hypothetical protein [candidate division Zixibacteria bacterium]